MKLLTDRVPLSEEGARPKPDQQVTKMPSAMPQDNDTRRTQCADIDEFSPQIAVRCDTDNPQAPEEMRDGRTFATAPDSLS
jgi:hypothetical protein